MTDPIVYVGDSEGMPLLVTFERAYGKAYADRARQWAVTVELALPRVDGNGLPPRQDWPALEAIEAALVRDLATDGDDWKYVVRLYGEARARYCFYAPRSAHAAARVSRVLAELPDVPEHRVQVQQDPKWTAYNSFFPGDEGPTTAPSFRDRPPYSVDDRPPRPRRDDQPWRGEEQQSHPED